jgi:hypothetical protein
MTRLRAESRKKNSDQRFGLSDGRTFTTRSRLDGVRLQDPDLDIAMTREQYLNWVESGVDKEA